MQISPCNPRVWGSSNEVLRFQGCDILTLQPDPILGVSNVHGLLPSSQHSLTHKVLQGAHPSHSLPAPVAGGSPGSCPSRKQTQPSVLNLQLQEC
jgi:hypothetical protein